MQLARHQLVYLLCTVAYVAGCDSTSPRSPLDMGPPQKGFATAQEAADDVIQNLHTNHFASAELNILGFASAAEASTATLGVPFDQFTLDRFKLQAYTHGGNPRDVILSYNQKIYTIWAGTTRRGYFETCVLDGQWYGCLYGQPIFTNYLEDTRKILSTQYGIAPDMLSVIQIKWLVNGLVYIAYDTPQGLMMVTPWDTDEPKLAGNTPISADDLFVVLAPLAK